MHTQPALLLGVLALAGEVLSVTFGAEGVHQQHGRQGRMNRRRGPGGTDSDGNPCKRGSDSSSSSSSSNSWKASSDIAKLSTGNVTVISATNDNEERSTTRQPLGSFDDLSSGRVSLEASTDQSDASSSSSSSSSADSWDSSSSDTWSSSSSWSSSDAAAAQPSGSGTSNGNGLSQVQSWSGNDFESWDFFTYSDPTHGNVNYVSLSDAQSQNLVGLQDGMFKMSVSTGNLVNGNRNSVRISSPTNWKKGQLLVADINHIPEGCGTWPALWSIGAKRAWPAGGEIDIMEGVNNVAGNTYTLHTTAGCSLSGQSDASSLSLTEDCQYQPGCSYKDRAANSYGPDFNTAGGGYYAAYLDDKGIKIWFWNVNDVPASIKNGSPVMSDFGEPKANFDGATCDMSAFFDDEQMIIINTTLMGDWAGATFSNNGCTGTQAGTLANAGNFNNAYWLINSVKIYA